MLGTMGYSRVSFRRLGRAGLISFTAHGYRQPQSEIASRIGARLNVPTILHVHGGFYTRGR